MSVVLHLQAITIDPVLDAQPSIAACLKDTTHLERHWDLARFGVKEVGHLHRISHKPIRQYGHSKAFAGPGTLISEELR